MLAIAVLGAVLYLAFNRALDRQLGSLNLSPEVRAAVDAQRRNLGAAETTDNKAREAIQRSFVTGYRFVLSIAVILAIAGSASAAVLIDRDRQFTRPPVLGDRRPGNRTRNAQKPATH